jgi:hypothetical protein
MTRREKVYSYEFRVVEEEEGTMYLSMRDLSNSRIVVDARFPQNDRTLLIEIDSQTGQCVLRSVS